MHYAPVVIIGAGQAGLAMSHCLTQRRIEHVVLERGQIAERWRSERWDSLHLLTPNWMSRLPGWSYRGDDPDGFMTHIGFRPLTTWNWTGATKPPAVSNRLNIDRTSVQAAS